MKLKRLGSILTCIGLLAALAAPCAASEPSFSDTDEIQNWEEVCMLYDLGLVSGYNSGDFQPDGYITRAQAAKIVAMILDPNAADAGDAPFSDMEGHWASPYVRYCTDLGLFSGYEDGTFLPDRNITARQLTKILLMAIGCDGSDYVGGDWAANVDADAEALGIYDGFTGHLDMDVTRDNACLLIFNALNCYAVETDADGNQTYVTDQLMNPITVLENRYGVVQYEQIIEANEYADLTDPDNRLAPGFTKIHGHREFAVSTDRTMLGRWMGIYMLDGTVIGIPYYSANEVTATFDSMEAFYDALRQSQYRLTDDTLYYRNYVLSSLDALTDLGDMVEVTVIDNDGDYTLDRVLVVVYEAATVLDGREAVLVFDRDMPAEEDESDEPIPVIDADQLINPPTRLRTGQQLWLAEIAGEYLVKTDD